MRYRPSINARLSCLAEEWHIVESGPAGSSARQSPVELACLTRGFFVAKLHPHSRRRALEHTRRKLALPKPAQTCPIHPSSIPSRRCSTGRFIASSDTQSRPIVAPPTSFAFDCCAPTIYISKPSTFRYPHQHDAPRAGNVRQTLLQAVLHGQKRDTWLTCTTILNQK